MKRILLHLAVSVLAFVLGVTVSALWRFNISVNTHKPVVAVVSEAPPPLELIKEEGGIACGNREAFTHVYYLSNGEEISRVCESLPSALDATNMLHERRRGSSDIFEWTNRVDSNGQQREAVVVFESTAVVRLSTSGSTFCETRATSMNALRWYDEHKSR